MFLTTHICANQINANHLNVRSLSAINANLGRITAGDLMHYLDVLQKAA
jgi:hypothetical protein